MRWVEVPNRKGDAALIPLRPVDRQDARPNSLSARHGLDEQPLHTDGAHHYMPPHWVLLFTEHSTVTDTLLWSEMSPLTNPKHPMIHRPASVTGGVFTVRGGKSSFLASAYSGAGGYRYDPGCMTAGDQRARDAVAHFGSLNESAYRHQWNHVGMALLIDNRRCLHGRAAVADREEPRELARVAFRTPAET